MSKVWRDITGEAAADDLEAARLQWLADTEDRLFPGRHDYTRWPRDVLAYHVRKREAELPYLRSGTRV